MFYKLIVTLMLFAPPAFAHGDHDHTPGTVQAPHGGMIQKTHDYFIEVVGASEGVKIYPLSKDLKPLPLNQIKISATYQIPRKKKEPVTLQAAEGFFEAKIPAKGAHRYALEVNITYQNEKELLTFQVEPQS